MNEEKKQTFQSVTLGLPEIKMVLMNPDGDAQNEASNSIIEGKTKELLDKEQIVRKIIDHLKVDL